MRRWFFIRFRFFFLSGIFALTCSTLTAAEANLKGQIYLVPGVEEYRLLAKFRASTGPDLDARNQILFRLRTGPLAKSSAMQTALSLNYRRVVNFTPDELRRIKSGDFGVGTDWSTKRFDIVRMAGLLDVEVPGADKFQLLALGQELESLPEVEYCSLEPLKGPPPPMVDLPPTTPDFTTQQGWLGPNPGSDCRYGWTQGALGQGVTVRDIEDAWGNLTQGQTHEDFDGADVAYVLQPYCQDFRDHGMAIFGMVIGQHNGYGIEGCAPRATARAYSFQTGGGCPSPSQNRPGAMTRMVSDSRPGDVLLLEMQTGGLGGDQYAPADLQQSIWDLTKQATDAGIIVVGTGSNGSANLDGSAYAAYRARGDNGVIMEGAGTSTTAHTKLSFSAYGRCCVHVQGWGQNVVTTGYGNLFDGDAVYRQRYSRSFSGTSSGGGHVTGVVALLQSYALQRLGRNLTPLQMRNLLISTGTPQGADSLTAHIGPLPNVRAAIAQLNVTGLATGNEKMRGIWSLAHDAVSATAAPGLRFEITLSDVFGRKVYRGEATASPSSRIQIPLARQPGGVYFLSVRNAERNDMFRYVLMP